MKVSVYLEKKNLEKFNAWLLQLKEGILSSAPVQFYFRKEDIKEPLMIFLDMYEYNLITDAKDDLKELEDICGPLVISYEPNTREEHLQGIKEGLRIANRLNKQVQLVYAALSAIKDIPSLTPNEAMIVAQRSVLPGFTES